ncbi:beta-galactosidase [Clostridium sp. Sa3CUN1]|uniref:Beta-galactosidase n=1 Tax=Clostridium gallinarum TaxID=2762246 RepID=A0ABR8Q503_9CLOT|nr:beta-galactosidase family protein [Clostridium gallinarum]MBD7915501.1 beta-galactosidase [Clostridium gallinarum]
MAKFEIREEFYLDDSKFKILSGAVHYFRINPSQWEDTLFNLKAIGFNTVETYIPWNVHEPYEGKFDFHGINDVEKFLEIAKNLGLYVILRPSPYICAEWEFGGLPAWLLKDKEIKLRSSDTKFINKLRNYYEELLSRLIKYQITKDGPVLMMQVENEYGSYGNEKEYLKIIASIMRENGIDVPLFTSDGTWIEALESGSLIEENIFVAGNFGSKSKENCQILKKFISENGKEWPLMCMEYWDGWFNRWGEGVIRRDAIDLAEDVREMLKVGSINLYMFRGGTNFGFMNGCSARGNNDLPQVTSYDYDAVLTEWGNPTDKYYELQKVIKSLYPNIEQLDPRKRILKNLGSYKVDGAVSLMSIISEISEERHTIYTHSMEDLDCNYGYILYRTKIKNYHHDENLKIIDASDRCHIYIDEKFMAVQYKEEIGEEVKFSSKNESISVDILVENLGRVNYGHKLNSSTQRKGIKGGVMINNHFQSGWIQYPLPFSKEMISKIKFEENIVSKVETPMFYRFNVELENIYDTFIDCSKYGKGCIFVNGFNIGRYWSKGPIQYLYLPSGFLKKKNEIIIFETENILIEKLEFNDKPIFSNI